MMLQFIYTPFGYSPNTDPTTIAAMKSVDILDCSIEITKRIAASEGILTLVTD